MKKIAFLVSKKIGTNCLHCALIDYNGVAKSNAQGWINYILKKDFPKGSYESKTITTPLTPYLLFQTIDAKMRFPGTTMVLEKTVGKENVFTTMRIVTKNEISDEHAPLLYLEHFTQNPKLLQTKSETKALAIDPYEILAAGAIQRNGM